jgi:predicted nucleotidyltransferase
LAADAVEQIARLRGRFIDRLRDVVAEWPVAAESVTLFGSMARGDGHPHSDIDLLIVRGTGVGADEPAWATQTDSLADRILDWTGNHAALIELGVGELPSLRQRSRAVLAAVRADGVHIAGRRFAALAD